MQPLMIQLRPVSWFHSVSAEAEKVLIVFLSAIFLDTRETATIAKKKQKKKRK